MPACMHVQQCVCVTAHMFRSMSSGSRFLGTRRFIPLRALCACVTLYGSSVKSSHVPLVCECALPYRASHVYVRYEQTKSKIDQAMCACVTTLDRRLRSDADVGFVRPSQVPCDVTQL